MKASDLIKRKSLSAQIHVPEAALAELRKLIEHNDSQSRPSMRVNAAQAIELLQSHGVKVSGRITLDRVCRERLGRKTYGTK